MKRRTVFVLIIAAIIVFTSIPASAAWKFQDIKHDAWYAEGIEYVLENGYMNGIDEKTYAPNVAVSRGMLVTVLHRMAGNPSAAGASGFFDVQKCSYYSDAISWAAACGIVNGYSVSLFKPNDSLTREQLAAILYRYAAVNGYDVSVAADLSVYSDSAQISAYAKAAMQWANAVGLISGTGGHTLSPGGTATRAQLATIIMRFEKTVFPAHKDEYKDEGNKKDPDSVSNTNTKDNNTSADGERPDITLNSVTASAGDANVKVVVSVKNNPGILGLSLTLTYDESIMTLKSISNGNAFKNVLTLTKSKTLSSGCSFIWDGLELSSSDIADGEILVLTFIIKDTVASGIYPLTIVSEDGYAVDNNLSKVPVNVVSGSITVK